jgi:hypothetical protein
MDALERLRDAVVDPVRSFARGAPSPVALYRSRRSTFGDLHLVAPSTVEPGERVSLTLQAWDRFERLVPGFDGAVDLRTTDPAATLPERVRFRGEENGLTRVEGVRFGTPGTHYVTAEHDGVRAVGNPIAVREDPEYRVLWGDIHLHSRFSDGAGSMDRGFAFGRDVMDLDVVAYTDHDTMGFFVPPTLQRWLMRWHNLSRIRERVEAHHEPGRFVTLFGYEWTKQPNAGGHINCYFETVEDAPLFDSRHPQSDTYESLWERLRVWREETGHEVVTVPHHPAEEMYPFDFSATDYDDELAPLVEVYSQWGSSEYPSREGNRKPIGGIAKGEVRERGHFGQDALALGNRVGFVAGSDFHGPRPGHSLIHVDPHLPSLAEWLRDGLGWGQIWRMWDERSYPGGLTAFYAPERTREAVFASLRDRQVYGTTQPDRVLVSLSVGGLRLRDAESVRRLSRPDEPRTVEVRVAGTAPIETVEVLKNNAVWRTFAGGDGPEGFESHVADARFEDDAPVRGLSYAEGDDRGTDEDAYYVRVVQSNGGMAWAGPVWVGVE